MVSPELKPQACWEFEGEILVLHHPTTISSRYQAMVHCGSIRQTASIVNMSKECLRTGDKAHVKFRFIKHPEYIRPGQRMVFREGRTKAVGNVLKPITSSVAVQHRPKPNKMQGRGGGGQQQQHHSNSSQNQNHNPNVQAAAAAAATGATSSGASKTNLDEHKSPMEGVLEVSLDKRDTTRGVAGKRSKRPGPPPSVGGNAEGKTTTDNGISQSNTSQHIAAKVQ